jgi:predicted Zn-dependent peptidase
MKVLENIQEARMDESVLLAVAGGGTRIAFARKPGFATSAAHFGVRFGSNDLRFHGAGRLVTVPTGSAHFLEHKLFEGRDEKVFDRFSRLGADFNGGTSFATTTYHFSSAGRFAEALEVLLDFVQHPRITPERVEKEKGIIEQEVRMYEDHPGYRGIFLLHRALYHNHPVRIPPGGSVADVHRTTAADLQACFDAFYRPEQLRLSIAGDLDPDEVLAAVDRLLDPAPAAPAPAIRARIPHEEPPAPASARLTEKFRITRPHAYLGWRDPAGPGLGLPLLQRRIATALALDLLFDRASPVHEDLYQAGIVDDSFHASYSADADWSHVVVAGETEDPERFFSALRAAVERFAAEGSPAADFERSRRASYGRVVSGVQTPNALAGQLLHDMLDEVPPFAVLDALSQLTAADVAARAQDLFRPERSAEALLLPDGT